MQIKDKVVIVTGASDGIGLEVARQLSQKGATVVLAARSADKLKKLEGELPGSLAITTDMCKPEDVHNLIQQVHAKVRPDRPSDQQCGPRSSRGNRGHRYG